MHDPSKSLAGWTIAFDLDGTLVETAPDLVGALNTVLGEEGLPFVSMSQVRLLVGRGARWLVRRGFELAGEPLDDARLAGLVERFIPIYLGRIAHESVPFPGCVEALEDLRARGARLAVCTNKPTRLSLALLDALDMTRLFEVVVGADEAPAAKPDPQHLLFTIERAGGDPARAVLVGDAAPDTGAAKAAGVPCVVVDFGYSETPAAELGGEALIGDYADLAAAVAGLMAACRTGAQPL